MSLNEDLKNVDDKIEAQEKLVNAARQGQAANIDAAVDSVEVKGITFRKPGIMHTLTWNRLTFRTDMRPPFHSLYDASIVFIYLCAVPDEDGKKVSPVQRIQTVIFPQIDNDTCIAEAYGFMDKNNITMEDADKIVAVIGRNFFDLDLTEEEAKKKLKSMNETHQNLTPSGGSGSRTVSQQPTDGVKR
jgi:hypothetical protein